MMPTRLFATALLLFASLAAHAATVDGPPLRKDLNEQVLMLPVKPGIFGFDLETTLFKPDGPGPFPLVVINHGKMRGVGAFQARERYTAVAEEFLKRGYLVALPMRRGFSRSGSAYPDVGCNLEQDARNQADDVIRVIELLRQRPDVDGTRILVMGQSHGGFASVAVAEREVGGLKAVINFAGGLRFTDTSFCNWEPALKNAFSSLGKKAKVDSLWFYGANDGFFPPDIAQALHDNYTASGGHAELVAYPAFRIDAHGMFGTRDGFAQVWWPKAEPFLKAHGLPTAIVNPQYQPPAPPKPSGYADSPRNINVLPLASEACKNAYRKFIDDNAPPRAFAFSGDGACGWAADSDDAGFFALKGCKSFAKKPCQLYLIDNAVVWPVDAAATVAAPQTTPES
ncbi:dienelactone hydrolase family protein [Jeongeupia chitinilytica]|nr:CocE/NonD family hydrolase [Jeongeupia chitinilytica]